MKGWIKVGSFAQMYRAERLKEALEQENISAVILNEKDSSFLIGEIEVYVEEAEQTKAEPILKEFNSAT